jgi:two-component system chemotaxis sensor kinase CheA
MAKDPYEYFRIEAREIVEGLGRGILQLEKQAAPEVTAGLLRLAHTLKGAARVVKRPGIAENAHAIEEVLGPLREPGARADRARIDHVLGLVDAISSELAALDEPRDNPNAGAPTAAAAEEPLRTVRADVAEVEVLIDGISEVGVQLRAMRRAAGSLERARHLADLVAEQAAPARAGDILRGAGGLAAVKLRAFTADLRSLVASLERDITGAVEQAERETQQVRDAAERLRLVPAAALFAPLERAMRDAAHALGKQASFTGRDGGVRLDAHVLNVAQAALMQMVRNAVAHGIEPPAERERAGKRPVGQVQLEITRRGARVAFVCRDDGRGIDLEAVRRVARGRGLLAGDTPALDAAAVLRLLLRGGLTTSDAVTQVSGRGIGLDIVRDAAARLGGDVTVETTAGHGTTLELLVPPSLSSLEVLLVEAAGVAAAIPLAAIQQTVRLGPDQIVRTPAGESIVHAGKVIPYLPLRRALGARAPADRALPGGRPTAVCAAIVDGGGALAAVGVDRLRGTANVVVRPLPPLAPADPVVAGAALDGDGTPQLVLDPAALVGAAVGGGKIDEERVAAPAPPVLVIDDSLTTRMLEQSILESAGYQVDLATSAEEGLEKARLGSYRLFLVDVEMPGMDGFSFVEKTRADPVLRRVPAIMVTSRDAPADRRRADEAGASGYIVKGDFDQGELLATIDRLVS